jgi:betaine-aldehyde dehydrogenase
MAKPEREDGRKSQLIEATVATIAEVGYSATTLALIGQRAGVSTGLVAHYFEDKNGLIEATLRSLGRRLSRATASRLRDAATPRARVQAVIDSTLAPSEFDRQTSTVWLAFWGEALHSPALRRIQRVYQLRSLSSLSHALQLLMPHIQARTLAISVAAMIDGLWLRATLSDSREIDSLAARRVVGALVDAGIGAIENRARSALPDEHVRRAYIGGFYHSATTGRSFASINPATGRKLADIEVSGAEEVEAAVRAAQSGHAVWAAMTGAERGRILRQVADLLRARNDELARLETLDTGKPIQETSAVDVISGAECFEYFAGLAGAIAGEQIDLGPSAFGYTRREPLGVVAGIGAWNYPLQIACWKSAPALACGNAMIFKPAELTPLTALKLAEIMTEAGVPPGVFNVLQGAAETGRLLSRHPAIRKISLTGEVGTGRAVMRDAADTLKYVTLELGGKSPLIIFEDADLTQAVSGALLANFYSAGEVCSNGTRVFIHRNVRERFLQMLQERVARMKIGDPLDPAIQVGALISEAHMQKVLDYVEIGQQEGAQLLCGGHRVTEGACADGYFVAPTIFAECDDGMRIVREEIFGPVMAVLEFSEEAEVIARANATEFGLSAGVFTRDLARAHRVIALLQAGTCWINHYNVTPIALPFGGVKQSGLGRENGRAAIEHYTQVKSVYVNLGDIESPY